MTQPRPDTQPRPHPGAPHRTPARRQAPPQPRRLGARVRGAAALLLTLGVVAGVPALLLALHLTPHSLPTLDQVGHTLRQRDDGQLAVDVIAAATWACWALFTASLATETTAALRRRPAPHIPGLGAFQRPAAALVAAVALALTLAPATAISSTTPANAATGSHTPPLASALGNAQPTATAAAAPRLHVHQSEGANQAGRSEPHRPIARYEVQRRDTLWGIAERHLGDPLRYPEIVHLNPHAVGPDNEITPGTILRMPPDATSLSRGDAVNNPAHHHTLDVDSEITVRPGDTLWRLAEDRTGDGKNWPQLWEANRHRPEPHGQRLTDPDQIQPGWTLSTPASWRETPTPTTKSDHSNLARHHTDTESTPIPDPAPTASQGQPESPTASPAATEPTQQPTPGAASSTSTTPGKVSEPHEDQNHSTASHLAQLIALTGATGAALAALLGLALARRRRQQTRHRRPGRVIAGTPADLVDLEQLLTATATVGAPDVTWLDHALRGLAQHAADDPHHTMPDVIAANLTDETLTLVLAGRRADPPPPWGAGTDGERWILQRADDPGYVDERRSRSLAPYPALASIGHTSTGEHWLLDLERVGTLTLAGDQERVLDLARFIAAELAHNTWSEMLHAELVGFAAELTPANPDRLTHHDNAADVLPAMTARARNVDAALRRLDTDILTGRVRGITPDAWAPTVLLAANDHTAARELQTVLDAHPRVGLAIVTTTDSGTTAEPADPVDVPRSGGRGWRLHVDHDGTAHLPALGLTLTAAQLPADEAVSLARLLAMAADTRDQPMPPARGDQPWDALADATGNLNPTEPQPGAATDAETSDVQTAQHQAGLRLAPAPPAGSPTGSDPSRDPLASGVDPATRQRVEQADPDLDADLAAWNDPTCPRPRLALLGRVTVRAQGHLPVERPREAFHTEVVAYLATRNRPAPSHEYATAMWPTDPDAAGKSKVTNSISVARAWLGHDPDTGHEYLPLGWYEAGSALYQVTDALIDAELFRRLRLRGLARGGPSGAADLRHALNLVTGRPFDHPEPREGSPGGYAWLAEANSRLDHEYSAMIVDTAHTLAQHHIAHGQHDAAAQAAQAALRADSYEDLPLLDLVEASMAQQKLAEAERYVQQILANHDAEIEEDLPPRTAEVLFRLRRTWAEQAS